MTSPTADSSHDRPSLTVIANRGLLVALLQWAWLKNDMREAPGAPKAESWPMAVAWERFLSAVAGEPIDCGPLANPHLGDAMDRLTHFAFEEAHRADPAQRGYVAAWCDRAAADLARWLVLSDSARLGALFGVAIPRMPIRIPADPDDILPQTPPATPPAPEPEAPAKPASVEILPDGKLRLGITMRGFQLRPMPDWPTVPMTPGILATRAFALALLERAEAEGGARSSPAGIRRWNLVREGRTLALLRFRSAMEGAPVPIPPEVACEADGAIAPGIGRGDAIDCFAEQAAQVIVDRAKANVAWFPLAMRLAELLDQSVPDEET